MRLKRDDSTESLLDHGPRSEYVKRFPEYPVQVTKSYRPPQGVIRSEEPIDSLTTQKKDYPEHPLERRQPFKPDNSKPELGRFSGHRSYREDYPEWTLPPKHSKVRESWEPPTQPFGGPSTIMSDYQEHQVSPRINYKPEVKPLHSEVPFPESTGYKDTFTQHQIPPRHTREKIEWQKPTETFESVTTQKKDFLGLTQPRQPSYRPTQETMTSDARFEADTTTANSYPPHEVQRRYKHEPEAYTRPDGKMEMNTTMGSYYKEHAVNSRQTFQKPDSSGILRGSGEMVKETGYATDFHAHNVNRRQMIKPDNAYIKPTQPVESETTIRADYHPHQVAPRKNYRPVNAPMNSEEPFDDRTGYKDTFKEHELSPRFIRTKETYIPPSVPVDNKTTAGESYIGAYQPRREAFKPESNSIHCNVPFDPSTTMNRDFPVHEVKMRQIHKQAEYERPSGDIDLNTTNNTAFTEMPIQRVSYTKPTSSNLLQGSGQMSSTTNNRADFIAKPIERRKAMKPGDAYEAPTAVMESHTTTRDSYTEKPAARRPAFRPQAEDHTSDVPFADRTENRDTFVPHEVTPRKFREREPYIPSMQKLEDTTTVRDSFKGVYQPRRQSFRPDKSPVRSDDPFDPTTTMGTAFREVKMPERFVRQQNVYEKPDGKMDMTTTHHENFKEVRAERQQYTKPTSSNLLRGYGAMTKETNYSNTFQQPPPTNKRELMKRRDVYQPPSVPVESTSTATLAYKEHEVQPRKRYGPQGDYMRNEEPFDSNTSYKERFTAPQLPPRYQMQKETYKPPSAPFDSRTTANDSYIGKYQARREAIRPDRETFKSDQPLETNTTFGSSFKPHWATEKRQLMKPDTYAKPEGQMDLTTVTRENFKGDHVERPSMRKLGDSSLLSYAGKFENSTSYTSDFVPKKNENRLLVKANNDYFPPSIPFENKTTYQASHAGHVAPRQRGIRPEMISDVLGQRNPANPFHIRNNEMGVMPKAGTASA